MPVSRPIHLARALTLLAFCGALAGCDQLGIETPAQTNQRLIDEGKAIGSSCRQAGRALEDCYQINPKAPKSAIFEGWREMDGYMRENKIEEIHPEYPMAPPGSKGKRPAIAAQPAAPAEAAVAEPAAAAPAKVDAAH